MTPQPDSGRPTPPPNQPLTALAFARDGSLLSTGKVKEDAVYFDLEDRQLRNARVFVLPEPEDGQRLEALTLRRAEQLNAYEPHLQLREDGGIELGQIPDAILRGWWWRYCCVRGRITNRVSRHGQFEIYPVCNAIVHVCEVDRHPWWIQRVPDAVLERLRHDLIERIPDPIPDPGPRLPELADTGIARIPQLPGVPGSSGPRSFSPPVHSLANQPLNSERETEIVHRLRRQDVDQFRQTLEYDYAILRPYLCFYPYIWPYFYHCERVGSAQTDSNGRYRVCFWHQEIRPDVYIWIEYPFTTGLETVYRPSMACYTRWNYDCSGDFNVQLRNRRIPDDCGNVLEGASVAIRAVGHNVSPMEIQQGLLAQTPVPGNATFRTVGLTNYTTAGLAAFSPLLPGRHVRPYTGDFPLIAQFGDALPSAGVRYFQVQYRRIMTAALTTLINPSNLNTGWKVLDSGALSRYYFVQQGLDFVYLPYSLGPETVNGQQVYRIPPLDPQMNGVDGQPASTDPTARWTQSDRVQIGKVRSGSLDGDGLYEFRIRFLDGNANLANVGADFFRVPDPAAPATTMAAPSSYLRNIGGDAVFQFRLRIDTAKTDVEIREASLVGSTEPMSECGFLEYTSDSQQVRLTFRASHPQDFAIFSFNLERGSKSATANHFPLGDQRGMVSGSAPPYLLGSDGLYRGAFPVTDLVAGCGDRATFSEALSIAGLHTDGDRAGDFFRKTVNNSFAVIPA